MLAGALRHRPTAGKTNEKESTPMEEHLSYAHASPPASNCSTGLLTWGCAFISALENKETLSEDLRLLGTTVLKALGSHLHSMKPQENQEKNNLQPIPSMGRHWSPSPQHPPLLHPPALPKPPPMPRCSDPGSPSSVCWAHLLSHSRTFAFPYFPLSAAPAVPSHHLKPSLALPFRPLSHIAFSCSSPCNQRAKNMH